MVNLFWVAFYSPDSFLPPKFHRLPFSILSITNLAQNAFFESTQNRFLMILNSHCRCAEAIQVQKYQKDNFDYSLKSWKYYGHLDQTNICT